MRGAEKLAGYRGEMQHFVGLSFATISAAGEGVREEGGRRSKQECQQCDQSGALFATQDPQLM